MTSAPTYMPGGMAPVATLPPPARERGKRRRLTLTADAGTASAASGSGEAALGQSALATPTMGPLAKAGAALDRIAGWILVVVVLAFVGMVAAAEISPGADAALRRYHSY